MTQLFIGAQEIFLVLFSLIVPIGITVVVFFIVYRMVDRWVNKSLTVRKEQNALLARLIDTLDKKG